MKKLFPLLLSLVLLVTMSVAATAAGTPTMKIGTVSAKGGETVTLDVTLQNNPGFCAASIEVQYDKSRLTLTKAELSEAFAATYAAPDNLPYVTFVSPKNITAADFLTLTFSVANDAPAGDAAVTIAYKKGDISDWDENDVEFKVVPGKVTGTDGAPVNPTQKPTTKPTQKPTTKPSATALGDVNGDGAVNMKDVLATRKHMAGMAVKGFQKTAADVNKDGAINMKDVLAMRKFIAGLTRTLGV